MNEWKDEFFNSGIRAIMTAPRGQPSHNLLDAFHRAYHQHEMDKCFSEDKKINAKHSKTPFLVLQSACQGRYN